MHNTQEILKSFNVLKKILKKDFSGFKKIKIALLGDSSTQLMAQCIKAYGYEEQINFDLYESDYNQIEQQIVDSSSELYQFQPEFIVIFQSTKRPAKNFYKKNSIQKKSFAQEKVTEVSDFYSTLTSNLKAKIIYFNFQEINDNVFGNFSNKTEQSFLYQLRKINFELMDLSIRCKNMFICDYNLISLQNGSSFCFDPKMYYTADMVLSIDVLPWVAKNITDIVSAISGKFKKCLILDLDNTLWGGIIGDDGIENIQIGDLGLGKAFTELQIWIRQLKERGIILAVCSKNTESVAKEPFQKHPDMLLSLMILLFLLLIGKIKQTTLNIFKAY
jgi:HAD superfamily phosphatase (TIGR01681 family)